MQIANAGCERIAIENPVGCMSIRFKKPTQIINPYEFGHKECKKTCLWLKGLQKSEPTNIIPKELRTQNLFKGYDIGSGKYLSWGSSECTKFRSKTFKGMHLQWQILGDKI